MLGVASPAWVWLSARPTSLERQLHGDRVVEGEPFEATIEVRRGFVGLPGAELHDPLANASVSLGAPLSLIRGGRQAHVRIVTRFARRGLRRLEPPSLIVHDPLELATLERPGRGPHQDLLVLPYTEPIRWRTRGGIPQHTDGRGPTEPMAAADVDGLRQYRPGTPASRIHWLTLARGGELMERRLRQDADSRPMVVLDARGDVPIEDLDAAVRAAASLALELAREGGVRVLLPGERRAVVIEPDLGAWGGNPCAPRARRGRTPGTAPDPRLRRPPRPGVLRRRPADPPAAGCAHRPWARRRRAGPARAGGRREPRRPQLRRHRVPRVRAADPAGGPGVGGVSARADVAVLLPAGGRRARAGRQTATQSRRMSVRVGAFAALGLYGTLRWATMLTPAPTWRMLGLLGVSIVVAGVGGLLAPHSRAAVVALVVVAILAAFALSGIPLSWIRHVRIAVTADGISEGLSALPRALVPYTGVNEWLRTVIELGAAVLLLDGAVMLALAPRNASDVRRAAAALPLVALAVVPSTLNRPALAYAHGLLLFGLVAAMIWGERLQRGEGAAATVLAILAGAAAMIAAPALDRHSPWLNYQALAGNLAPAHPETFDWSQRYGPLHWPRNGHAVFEVQAPRPDYWKTENLDVFNGRAWVDESEQVPTPDYAIDAPGALKEWSEQLHVTLRGMRTTEVIAAGTAHAPAHIPSAVAGVTDGTWTVPTGLAPGDSYTVDVYSPHPSTTELVDSGTTYPSVLLPAYTSLVLPPDAQPKPVPGPATPQPEPVYFPPFGSQEPTGGGATAPPGGYARLIKDSVYARAWSLSQRLLKGANTPYSYVLAVKNYLSVSNGFRYDENPALVRYPLETFLFTTKRGYCQQFAGAMALLLRMGGIPARVATGFTSGTYDSATHSYVVSDIDAHAWVEVWFPHYGWVRFDPTPAAAPARGGQNTPLPAKVLGANPGRGSTGLGGRTTPAAASDAAPQAPVAARSRWPPS